MNKLKTTDPQIYDYIQAEEKRLKEVLEMIPSENYTSTAVMETLGTVLTNKYSEGYAKKRYYQGNAVIDDVELLAIERAKKLFKVEHVNVQAYSGSPANAAIEMALLEPGKDVIMGLSLSAGGHLTHGAEVSFSGKFFKTALYSVDQDGMLDFEAIEQLARKSKPKLIICGATAYPRIIDFKRFGEIGDAVGAFVLADISHIAGLVAGGAHPSPIPYVDVVMTTTHKTLRGPRGALIMVTQKGLEKDPQLAEKIDKAVFPGLQGGPHDNQTAAIAVALLEASKPEFKTYAKQIVKNSKALASELTHHGFNLVSGGSDNHLLLIDLRNKYINGSIMAIALEYANIVVNKNAVPYDTMPPFYPSGIRLGTPAITTRGMKESDMKKIAHWIYEVASVIEEEQLTNMPIKEERAAFVKKARQALSKNKRIIQLQHEIKKFCLQFPMP